MTSFVTELKIFAAKMDICVCVCVCAYGCVCDDREQWVRVDQFDGDGPRGPDIAQPQRRTRHHSGERHGKILESLCEEAWNVSIISSADK